MKVSLLKNLIVVLAAVSILFGAYAITFGPPAAIVGIFQQTATSEEAGAEDANGRPERPSRGPRGATTVVLADLEAQSYALTLRTIGTANSLRSIDVVVTVSGQIASLQLPLNGSVEAGDILVRLDETSEQLALEIAIAERDLAQATLDRYARLAESGIRTNTDADLVEAGVALRLAEANVALAENAVEERIIRAPISGQLGLTDLQVGDYLNVNDAVVSIEDNGIIIAEFEVPERSIALLEAGREVLIGTPTYRGQVFRGEITSFDTQLDSVTRSATVRAEIDNSEGLLRAGMSFGVRMIEETDPLPVVPSTAITWDQDGAGIWVVENETASRVPVTIRYREGDLVWIETDVQLGVQIVAEGAIKLREGATVTDAGAAT